MIPYGPNGPQPWLIQPTRRTQPYRAEGGRAPGPALTAMLNGRSLYGQNPMDMMRQAQIRPGSLAALLMRLS